MNDHRLFRQDGGSGTVPPPPPPPPGTPPPPPPPSTGSSSTGIPAWIMGKKEINAIDAGQSSQAGRTLANIGMWLGIINVILSIIALIVVGILVIFGIISDL
jgi:hypothetical protein